MTNRTDKRTLSIRALLVDEITQQLGGIRKEVEKVAARTEKANKRSEKSWAAVRKAALAVGAAYAAIKVVTFSRELNQQTEELVKVARATGETIENLSELRFAFREAGGNGEQFRAVMSSLAAAQGAALEGAQRQIDAFAKLGVEVDELVGKNPIDVFRAMASGIGDLNEGSEQYLELVKLFPEQWRNVINLIGEGSTAFENSLTEARKAGATITGEQARAAVAVEKQFRRVETAIQSVTRELTVEFGPALTNGLKAFATALLANKNAIKQLAAITVRTIATVAEATVDAVQILASIPQGLQKTLDVFVESLTLGFVQPEDAEPSPRLQAINEQIEQVEVGLRALDRAIDRNRSKGIEPSERRLKIYEREINKLKELRELQIAEQPLNVQLEFASGRIKGLVDSFFKEVSTPDSVSTSVQVTADVVSKSFDEVDKSVGPQVEAAGKRVWDLFFGGVKSKAEESKNRIPQTFTEGLERGFSRLQDQLQRIDATSGELIAGGVTRAVDNLSNSIAGAVTGAQTLQEAFRQWGVSTLQIIAQVISKMLVLRAISLFTGGGSTSSGGGSSTASASTLAAPSSSASAASLAPIYVGPSAAANAGNQVTINIQAWDGEDATRALVNNSDVIRSIFTEGVSTRRDVRHAIQKGAR